MPPWSDTSGSQQASKPASQQASKPTSQQASMTAKPKDHDELQAHERGILAC